MFYYHRFTSAIGTHKQFYTCLLGCIEQLVESVEFIPALLNGSAKPRKYPLYDELKELRELLKQSLHTGHIHGKNRIYISKVLKSFI